MFAYELIGMPNIEVEKKYIDKIFQIISNSVSISQNGIINIVFLDDDSIQKLNKQYRNKDTTTDVLSFHYFEDFSHLHGEDIAGEVVLSHQKILEQSKEYGLTEAQEFYKLLIHSLLHILGYDHEEEQEYKIMQEKEDQIWQEVFEK